MRRRRWAATDSNGSILSVRIISILLHGQSCFVCSWAGGHGHISYRFWDWSHQSTRAFTYLDFIDTILHRWSIQPHFYYCWWWWWSSWEREHNQEWFCRSQFQFRLECYSSYENFIHLWSLQWQQKQYTHVLLAIFLLLNIHCVLNLILILIGVEVPIHTTALLQPIFLTSNGLGVSSSSHFSIGIIHVTFFHISTIQPQYIASHNYIFTSFNFEPYFFSSTVFYQFWHRHRQYFFTILRQFFNTFDTSSSVIARTSHTPLPTLTFLPIYIPFFIHWMFRPFSFLPHHLRDDLYHISRFV